MREQLMKMDLLKAQADRAPTQRFVDQFSKIYTPIMVVLAILVALIPPLVFSAPFYPWIAKALILLVIACPCALVISTPVTVVSGLAAAAKLGLLIKGGTYLENGHKLQAIALDKTGTLTQGKPAVTDIVAFNNITNEQLLTIAASLDTHSEHPVAYAIVNHWESKNIKDSLLEVDQFLAIPGRGVTGYIENKQYYVGNHKLAEENGICNAEVESVLEKIEQEGKTTVVISTSRQVLGIIAVSDSLRPSSKEAISRLRKIGVKTIMLTGDNKIMAQTIGKQVGIDEVNANMLPEDKLAIIDRLINKYKYVGMVGDGINDAPALAKASIGFAMGKEGANVALETADVALMDNNLVKLTTFIKLSKKTRKILIQNISFSIIVKIIFFILAIAGKASLWIAVFADMGASLVVVFNGLRLLKLSFK
ncbi:MAG: heavy metal translocating P-type ATPase [Burkholderiales bacterium]|nr:heavy metal translocating P-type ATPase [Burkholderiales bacterium]